MIDTIDKIPVNVDKSNYEYLKSLNNDSSEFDRYLGQYFCKSNLKFLCCDVLGMRHWDKIHDDLNRFLSESDKRFRLILMPRGHLKTSIITIGLTIQKLLINPNRTILLSNAVWDNARSFLSEIKEYLIGKSILPMLFGKFQSPLWNVDEVNILQKTKPSKTPSISTAGIDKALTSQHYDIIIADDIVNRQTINTQEQRDKVRKYYSDLLDLLEPDGEMYVVGTRWHDDDLYGQIIEQEKDKFDGYVRQAIEGGQVTFPKKFSQKILDDLKSSKGSYEFSCTPSETPILMSDWKTKPIEYIKVGDEIVGFETFNNIDGRSRLVKTRVRRVFSKQDHVLKLIMNSGRKVLCTDDHRWYTGRYDESHKLYKPAKRGSKLLFVCPVENEQKSTSELLDWNYLAGLFDGEGSTYSGGCLNLSQSQSVNMPVYNSMLSVLDRLKIKYGINHREDKSGSLIYFKDSFNVGLNLIRNSLCAKSGQIADRFFRHGKRFVKDDDEVMDIQYDSFRTVHALETETGNYIAWGYASSNCQYQNDPVPIESQHFKQPYRVWKEVPENIYQCVCVDLAVGDRQDSDYSVVFRIGRTKETIYGIEYARGHFSMTELVDKICTQVSKCGQFRKCIVETNFFKFIEQVLRDEFIKRNIQCEIIPIHQVKDKFSRIMALQPYHENGNLLIKQGMIELEEEFSRFPSGKHDDVLDSLAMSLQVEIPNNGIIKGRSYVNERFK